ncbi:MAG: 4-hydroxybenzoate octaprenyltransferase [Burkholderiaceae bacterium]|jgi:4-hydroxybenzoate polyprenyltransferase|nr:4-hydroxybenzoate octaprenyltransferase [Burkholderiaceae bacterium]
MTSRFLLYLRLIRIEKPIGYMLLVWPTLWGLWIAAGGWPGWPLFLIFSVGAVLMHSAGCAINDFADRDFDRFVERTRDRPLTAGLIAPWEAVAVAILLSVIAFLLLLPLNLLTKILAVPALFIAAAYPWLKRFFAVPQAWLGLAFGFGIPMAFAAVRNDIPATAWLLMLGNGFWTLAYDTEYAMADKADDLKIGIRTSAITFGRFDITAVMLCQGIMLIILFFTGMSAGLGSWFVAGLIAAALCALWQYRLIRERDRMRCHLAFRYNNWTGMALFAGILLDYALH